MHAITAMIVTLIIPLVLLATPGTSHGDRVGAETYEVQRGIQHTKDALGMEAHARPQTGGQFTATETGASAKTRRETGRHIEAETGASAKTRKETGRYTETETGASAKTRREIEIDARTEIRTGQGGEARSGDPWEGIDSGEGTATGAKASAWKARETETTVQTDTLAGRQTNTGGTGGEHSITWGRPNTQGAHFAPDTARQVTVMVGQRARLLCTVLDPDTRHVSWIRQRDLHIMTVGIFTYTRDDRFKVYHPEKSNDWHLDITSTTFRDAGVYECQVSTSPKISLPVTLTVQVQAARIEGPREVYIQNGSTIRLTCEVRSQDSNTPALTWHRDGTTLDYDSPRGGVSVEIEKTPTRTTSKLFLTRATRADSGNYTCDPHTADAAVVRVHVVSGEESAAVHIATALTPRCHPPLLLLLLVLLLLCGRR